MKLTMESRNLLEGLNVVTRALASKPAQPILEGVNLVTENGHVTLTCSDGNFMIRWHGECRTDDDGSAILPGKLFAELVRKLPAGDVHMESDGTSVSIRCQKSRSKLSVIAGAEYPDAADVNGYELNVPQAAMKDMINHVSFAIATDESRLILTGGFVEITRDEVRMVALDGFRLAMQKKPGEYAMPDGKEKISAVIPGRALNEMSRVLNGTDENCVLTIGDGRMMCRAGAVEMSGSLLAGEFVDYRRILPDAFQTEVIADVTELSEAIDRASLMAREGKNNLIKLSFTEESVKISSNAEMGNVEEEMEVSTHGENLNIAFNSNYLRDMLKNLDGDRVVLKFNAPTTPCVAVPQNNTNCVQLLLPVRTFA